MDFIQQFEVKQYCETIIQILVEYTKFINKRHKNGIWPVCDTLFALNSFDLRSKYGITKDTVQINGDKRR